MSFVAAATLGAGALMGAGTAASGRSSGDASRYSADQQALMNKEQLAQQLVQLRGRSKGQQEAQRKAQDIYGRGRSEFSRLQGRDIDSLSGTPEEVTKLQDLIRKRAVPEQQQALAQGKLALQQSGTRGPEAALMSQMQSNQLGENLARSTQEVALKQALGDRSLRQQEDLRRQQGAETFAQQQALMGMGQSLKPVEYVEGRSPDEQKADALDEKIRKREAGSDTVSKLLKTHPKLARMLGKGFHQDSIDKLKKERQEMGVWTDRDAKPATKPFQWSSVKVMGR